MKYLNIIAASMGLKVTAERGRYKLSDKAGTSYLYTKTLSKMAEAIASEIEFPTI